MSVASELRIREGLKAAHQGDNGEAGQRILPSPRDVMRIETHAWPVRLPHKRGRELLVKGQSVVDLPPVRLWLSGRQDCQPAEWEMVCIYSLEPVQGGNILAGSVQ